MVYEPGSTTCRVLIDVKHSLEDAIKALNGLDKIDHIKRQLKSIHKELEELHEVQRFRKESMSI